MDSSVLIIKNNKSFVTEAYFKDASETKLIVRNRAKASIGGIFSQTTPILATGCTAISLISYEGAIDGINNIFILKSYYDDILVFLNGVKYDKNDYEYIKDTKTVVFNFSIPLNYTLEFYGISNAIGKLVDTSNLSLVDVPELEAKFLGLATTLTNTIDTSVSSINISIDTSISSMTNSIDTKLDSTVFNNYTIETTENLSFIDTKISSISNTFNSTLTSFNTAINTELDTKLDSTIFNTYSTEIEDTFLNLYNNLDTSISSINTELDTKLDSTIFNNYSINTSIALSSLDANITNLYTTLENTSTSIINSFSTQIETTNNSLNNKIDSKVSTTLFNSTILNIVDTIGNLSSDLDTKVSSINTSIDTKVSSSIFNTYFTEVDTAILNLNSSFSISISTITNSINTLQSTDNVLNIGLTSISNSLNTINSLLSTSILSLESTFNSLLTTEILRATSIETTLFTTLDDFTETLSILDITGGGTKYLSDDGTYKVIDTGTIDYNALDNQPQINSIILEGNKSASDLGLASTSSIPTSLTQLSDDATHRLVTDAEKSIWNNKQSALGFTPENVVNKTTILSTDSTDFQYPTAKTVYTSMFSRIVGDAIEETLSTGGVLTIITTNGIVRKYWVGTTEEWDAGRTASLIDDTTQCYITDDEAVLDIDTSNVNPSTDRNYVTDLEKTAIGTIGDKANKTDIYFKATGRTITVGTGGNFTTLSAALTYAANNPSVYTTISLLNNISEASIAINNYRLGVLKIDGNGHTLTLTSGNFTVFLSTLIELNNMVINITNGCLATTSSDLNIVSCTITYSVETYIQFNSNVQVNSSTFNFTRTGDYKAIYILHQSTIIFNGTSTVNYTNGSGVIITLENNSSGYIAGTLNIVGNTTNKAGEIGIMIFQSRLTFAWGTAINISNAAFGLLALNSGYVSSNLGRFTCNVTNVTTKYSPTLKTYGNDNSYIQVPS